MIGAAIRVLISRTAELRHHQHRDLIGAWAEVSHKGLQAGVEFGECASLPAIPSTIALPVMRIPAAEIYRRGLEPDFSLN